MLNYCFLSLFIFNTFVEEFRLYIVNKHCVHNKFFNESALSVKKYNMYGIDYKCDLFYYSKKSSHKSKNKFTNKKRSFLSLVYLFKQKY